MAALVAQSSSAFANPPIRVVAAENFYGDLARQIGGNHVLVTSILANPDDDPHLFETSVSTARDVAGATVVIFNGIDYDPWMSKLLSASGEGRRAVVVAADVVGAKHGDNPHLWYDLKTLPAVARRLASEFERTDPADAKDFGANLKTFEASFAQVAGKADALKATYAGTPVTATEPVFGYMAAALGLTMLNDGFQLAVMNNAEPSASQTAAFEDSLTSGKVKLLFYNSQVTDKTTDRLLGIAKAHGIPVVGVTETEPKDLTIQTWFTKQIDAVRTALAGKPT